MSRDVTMTPSALILLLSLMCVALVQPSVQQRQQTDSSDARGTQHISLLALHLLISILMSPATKHGDTAVTSVRSWAAQPGGVRGTLSPSLLRPGGYRGYNENDLPDD